MMSASYLHHDVTEQYFEGLLRIEEKIDVASGGALFNTAHQATRDLILR